MRNTNDIINNAIGNSKHIQIYDKDVYLMTWDTAVKLASFDDDSVSIVPYLPVGITSRRQVRRFITRLGRAGVDIPFEVRLDMARFA